MKLQELKALDKERRSRTPWGLKLQELRAKDSTIEKGFLVDGFAEHFKVSKMSELEKVAFIEKWAEATEAGRYILEEAFLCDCEGQVSDQDWDLE